MGIQVPLLVIDQKQFLGHVYIVLEPIGSARLTFIDDIVLRVMYVSDRMLFEVPDKITDMTRNSGMVRR